MPNKNPSSDKDPIHFFRKGVGIMQQAGVDTVALDKLCVINPHKPEHYSLSGEQTPRFQGFTDYERERRIAKAGSADLLSGNELRSWLCRRCE